MDKHHGNPPPVPFKLICKLRGRIENLEDEETTLQGNRTATPTDEVLKCSDSHGVVLDPVMVTPNKLALKDERALQEIKEAWLPQDGFQRQPVELSVQVSALSCMSPLFGKWELSACVEVLFPCKLFGM